jgi:hypothetical protein
MKRRMRARLVGVALAFLTVTTTNFAMAQAGRPTYASEEAREVIQKMIEAHGGLDKWQMAKCISFNSHLKVDFGGGNWVSYWEEIFVEQPSRRVYAKLPNPDGTYGQIAYDGKEAWSAGVHLGKPGRAKLPDDSKEYVTVRMTFGQGTGDTFDDYYLLYIDPDEHTLHAAEYVNTYAAIMQGGASASPPSIFVWEGTKEVNGLRVLSNYTVYWKKDFSVAVKDGRVSAWSFSQAFDESQMNMPADGKIDTSKPRKS